VGLVTREDTPPFSYLHTFWLYLALRGAFLISFGLEKSRYIATAAAIALAVDFTRIPVYVASGFLGEQYYFHIPVLFAIALAGSFTGKMIVEKIPQEKFRKFVLFAIALASLTFIADGAGAYLGI
jgi:uncharacterized protein